MSWQTLKVGGGGYADGIDIDPDGTIVVRTDGAGAYLWNGSQWQQLVSASSMPASFDFSGFNSQSVYEIQMAPSNSSIMYMNWEGYVLKSTNKGTTWTQTSFAPVTENGNDNYRYWGQKMAVDPNNPNIVYAGTPQNGLFVTTNGGQTWSRVGAIPVSKADSSGAYPGITGILFDPAIGGAVNGVTQTIFASSYGNGVYESTNGGSTWTQLSGGPSAVNGAAISSTGVYYAVSNSSSVWGYANGQWTQLTNVPGQTFQTIAVNPSNPNEIVAVTSQGTLDVSYNAGATWSGINQATRLTSADVPWLAAGNEAPGNAYFYMSIGGAAFNPTTPNELITSGGTGAWSMSVPASGVTSSTPLTWSDMTTGIENLTAIEIIVPPGGDPVLASWDRPFFKITNPAAYPSTYGPVNSTNINAGWSVDYASSNPSFIVGIADWYGVEQSGYSTNGGQTWTKFASTTPVSGGLMGGTIAASTPQDIVWAPSGGHDPYYTLNGGATWSPIALPGVTSWSNFDWGYYFDQRSVTADRVLANTFYLYYPGQGVFSSTNGGQTWSKVYSGTIGPGYFEGYNSTLMSVPGEASNLFYTGGPQGTVSATPANEPFYRSTNGGATWTTVPNVQEVLTFGFGAAAPGQSYPAIYIVGYVNSVYGIWQSTNNAQSWTNIGTYPNGNLGLIRTIAGDPNHYGEVYVGFAGGGYAYLPAGSTTTTGGTGTGPTTGGTGTGPTTGGTGTNPTITGLTESPATGDLNAGKTVALTLAFSSAVTVAGKPTLKLNDGGTATYVSGSGTKALTFNYMVAAGQSTASLAATAVSLPSGVTIKDSAGNAANLSLAGRTQSGPQIDTTAPAAPAISSDTVSGNIVTLKGTAAASSTITVFDNSVKLGTATTNSSGGWTFATRALAGGRQSFTTTATDGAGNVSSLSSALVVTIPAGSGGSGPTTGQAPAMTAISESPAKGHLNAGKTATLTLTFSEAVTVVGRPTLRLIDGGTATYASGSGGKALTFAYTVAAGQNTASLAATAVNLASGVTIKDSAGNAASLSLVGRTQSGPQIDTTIPTVTGISKSPAAADLGWNQPVVFTLTFSEPMTVAGRPTLTLNDGGTAYYQKGSSTNTLTFYYHVAAGQNIAALAATTVNLPSGAAINDSAGNAAKLLLTGLSQRGPQIDTTAPTVTSLFASPAKAALNTGKTVALTLNFSEPVTVAGGRPTLTLNDRGTATYVSGSGSKALTFNYIVAAGQNVASLGAAWVNLASGVTIKDSAGNAAKLSLRGLSQSGPQIDTTAPTVKSVVASPVNRTQLPGDSVTMTVKMSEAVTVGGMPTLSLNDGGSAKYIGGSGTNTLTFKYTVGSSDRDVSALAISAVSLAGGAKILDSAGNVANMAGAIHSFAGLAVDPPIVSTKPDGSYDVAYSDVTGLGYSSYEDIFNSGGIQVAEARDMIGGAGTLILNADHLTVSASAGSLRVTTGSDTFKVNSHASESIIASGRTAETFEFGSGFGHESITGLLTSGASHDVIELPLTTVKGLSSTNTATQNWNALLSSGAAVQSGANVTITDAAHDILALNRVTISTLSHDAANLFKFV